MRALFLYKKLSIFLVCFILLSSYKRIEIVSNFMSNPNDQNLIDSFLKKSKTILKEKDIELQASDLLHDLTDRDILFTIVWNSSSAYGKKPIKAKRLPKDKAILFIWEPPTILPDAYKKRNLKYFKKIYTFNDSLVDGKKFFKFYYPVLHYMQDNIVDFEDKKLLVFVFSNKQAAYIDKRDLYPERKALIEFFENKPPGEFECYGSGWEKFGYKNYKGSTPDKIATLKNFRFTVAYENTKDLPGYITEKIFDAFEAGSIPIYWGASNVTDFIPASCFIDRRKFSSNEELYRFLKQMDKDTYNQYLDNIRGYLKSDKAALFSLDKFQEIFLEAVDLPLQNFKSL